MSVLMTNGKPRRKQLSDELDRFDGIIDALAGGHHRRGGRGHPRRGQGGHRPGAAGGAGRPRPAGGAPRNGPHPGGRPEAVRLDEAEGDRAGRGDAGHDSGEIHRLQTGRAGAAGGHRRDRPGSPGPRTGRRRPPAVRAGLAGAAGGGGRVGGGGDRTRRLPVQPRHRPGRRRQRAEPSARRPIGRRWKPTGTLSSGPASATRGRPSGSPGAPRATPGPAPTTGTRLSPPWLDPAGMTGGVHPSRATRPG
jgi:translation initiation factor IF-2